MARSFAGGTDRIWFNNTLSLIDFGGTLIATGTLAFWMKTSQATANAALFSFAQSDGRNGIVAFINNTANKITCEGQDGGPTSRIKLTSSTSINNGAWHHVAFAFNNANGAANELYIDGAVEASGNSSAAWVFQNSTHIYLGDSNNTFWPSYTGELAEVGFWQNRKLDAAEVAALAKGASPILIAPQALGHYSPLVRDPYSRVTTTGREELTFGGITGTTVSDHPRMLGGYP